MNEGASDGSATVSPIGGSGNLSIVWYDGLLVIYIQIYAQVCMVLLLKMLTVALLMAP